MIETNLYTALLQGGITVSLGAVAGSFAATTALRMANGRDFLTGRSHCDGCDRPLRWTETLPLIGYALARGRCQSCGAPIARFHLVGEALGAVVLALPVMLLPPPQGMLTGLLCLLVLMAALIDQKTLRLPDLLTGGIGVLALALAVLSEQVLTGLLCAFVAVAVLYGVKCLLERQRGRAMLGLGDIKLVMALALWLNLRIPAMIALAALLGLIVIRQSKGLMPFGPMMAVSAFIVGVLIPESWLV